MKNLKSVSVQVIDSDIAVLLPNGVYEIKQMETKSSRLKQISIVCFALAVFGIFGFGYFCPEKVSITHTEPSVLGGPTHPLPIVPGLCPQQSQRGLVALRRQPGKAPFDHKHQDRS